MSELLVYGGWLRANPARVNGYVVIEADDWGHCTRLEVSVDEAIQFSRMIVKAAAEAAGVKEGVK